MSDHTLQARITAVGTDGHVSADEVLFLRRTIFADGVVSAKELNALFALAERAPDGDPEWPQYFAEAAADFYLREEEPHGYLTPNEFTSLKAQVMRDGGASSLEVGLLVKLMETATQTPPEMGQFVGEQIKYAITNKPNRGGVDKKDVMLMRRYLFAAGGDGNVAITRAEAEILFDIKDAMLDRNNDPAWADLFVTGVINHLMAHIGYEPLVREEALAIYTPDPDDGGPIERPVLEGETEFDTAKVRFSDTILNIFAPKAAHRKRVERRYAAQNAVREVAAERAEKITPEEADWVANRIGRDGAFDKSEKQLINRMRELKADLPDTLKELVSRAA